MKTIFKTVVASLLIVIPISSALASGPGTTSAIILKNNSSPRAEAMGEAHIAVSDDEAGAAGWNPAGLYNCFRQEAGGVYFRGIIDDFFGSITYSQTFAKKFSLGGTLLFYDAGQFELITLTGETSQIAAERDIMGVATGAYKLDFLDREFLVGANLKLIYSSLLETASAFGIGLDLGAMYEVKELLEDLQVGLTIKNIGTPMAYEEKADPMPIAVSLGGAYKLLKGEIHELILAADGSIGLAVDMHLNLGAEYWHEETVAFRVGYKFGYDLDSLTAGIGVRYQAFQMDYAFSLMSALNSTHKAGLTYTLSVDEKRREEVLKLGPKVAKVPKAKPRPKVKPEPTPVPSVMAEVLEIEKIGGEVKNVFLSVGQDKKIRKGYKGVIFNASGMEIAKIKIMEVYPNRCRARVMEKSGEISSASKVEIKKER